MKLPKAGLLVAGIVLMLAVVACASGQTGPTPNIEATVEARLAQERATTPNSTADLERQAIISFTLQALEIEAKRKDLIAYFDSLSNSVGTYGKALAIERYFSKGVPPILRGAFPSGFEGMTILRNRLFSLDNLRSMQIIKRDLLNVYDTEIQLASDQLAYPEITIDSLDYWRKLVTDGGPNKRLYEHKVGTVWFGLQEIRQQTYTRWAKVLQEHAIDLAGAGVTIQNAPKTDFRLSTESTGEALFVAPFVTYFRVLGIEDVVSPAGRYHLAFSQKLRDLFRVQQRIGIFTASGIEPEPDWESYVQLLGGRTREVREEAERILSGILGMTPEQREQAWLSFEPGTPSKIEELQDFIRTGTRASRGHAGSELLAGRVPNILLQWQIENPQTDAGTPMPFLDFLTSRLGISGLLKE